jgi:hypothetical protein
MIQFPAEIDEILRQRADNNVRSINGEVVHLVRYALRQLRQTETQTGQENENDKRSQQAQ